jgi:two-component system OmpR family response regulator
LDDSNSRTDARLPGLRILVVDDSRETAQMMSLLLKHQGHAVTLAFAGREAIKLIESYRPDVVLLDLKLPDISGAEVVKELRGRQGFETTSFVAISGFDADRLPPLFDAHFVKPVDHDRLNEFLSQLASNQTPRIPGPGFPQPQ